MEKLLPDQLKELWQVVAEEKLTPEAFALEQERLLSGYRKMWRDALCLKPYADLQESLLTELGTYVGCDDPAEIESRCHGALAALKEEWRSKVVACDAPSVEKYYAESQSVIYELMWWHTLADDISPLAYVTALHFARRHGCRRYLDFGAGVGSGGLLFAKEGLDVTLADISSPLQDFCKWRFGRRGWSADFIDLKTDNLPAGAFDLVTAMDVFEHLVDPVETAERLWQALVPGGFLFTRLAAEEDEDRPQHIVLDFDPVIDGLKALGFVQVWQDEWLWGHKVFQKPGQ